MKKNLRNKFSLFKYFLLICVSITTLIFGMNEGFAQSDDDLESRLLNLKPHNSKTTRKKRGIRSNSSTYNLNNNRERDTQPPTASEKPKAKKNFLGKIFGKKAPTEEKFTTIPNDFSLVQDPPKQEGYNLRASVSDLLKNNQEMTNNPLLTHLNQQYTLQEHIERFDEYLNNNEAITALEYAEDTKLSSELKKTAVDKILSDLNEQNIKQILFVDNLKDVRILDFTKPINKENRPILAAIIQNASEEQKDVFFDRVVDYVDRNLITLETQRPSLGVRLVLTQLKSINNKKEIEKLLLRKNKIKEKLKKYYKNGKYENIPQKVIAEINKKLKADSLITNDLNQNEIISLINGFDTSFLEKSINIISSSPETITKEIKEKLLSTSQPVLTEAAWTGTTPPPLPNAPPPPIHNNHNLNINDLEQNHPALYELHEELAKQGNNTQQKPLSTKANKTVEITEPTTEYGELYKTYLTESNKQLPTLYAQQIGAEINITNTIRQILTDKYKDILKEEALINLFSKDNQDSQAGRDLKSKATKIYEELSKDPYVTQIISFKKSKDRILNNLFQEDSDKAMDRLLLPSSKISENQKNFILTIQTKEQKEQELAGYNDRLEQLRFIANNSNVFGSQKLNDIIEELVNDSSKLTNMNKVHILLDKDKIITNLKNIASVSKEQINNLRTNIIKTINLEAIKAFASDNNINSADFIRLIQESKKHEILREFLAVVVTIEENKQTNTLPQYNKLALPSIANFSQEDVALLSQRMTVAGLIKALTEIGQENIVAQQQNKLPTAGAVPPPPPPSMMTSSELDKPKLKAAGINDDLIEKALKLKANNNKIIPKTPITPNKFNSSAGKKYSERITKNATSFEFNIKMHGAGKVLNDIILESVLEIYAKKPFDKLDEKVNTETFEEALSTLSPDFIGPRTELGDEIHKIYNEIIAETVKDTEFLKNLAKDIKPLTGNKLLDKAIKTQADALEEEKALELVPELFAQAEKDYENQQEALKAKVLEQQKLEQERINAEALEQQTKLAREQKKLEADAAAIALEQQRLEQERIDAEALEQQIKLAREQKKLEADTAAKALEEEKALELVPELFAQAEKDYENQQEALKAKALEQEQLNADAKAITQPQTQEEVTEEAATTGIIQSNDEENNTSKALTDDESDISKQSLDNSIIKEEENINDEKEKDNDQQLSQNLEPLEVEVLVSKKISGIDQSEEIILEEDRLENIKAKIHSAYNYIRDIINKPAILERVKYFLSAGPAAAGDEDTTIEKGVWISGLYNINKHGVWKDMPGYKGRTTGVTIGADTEFNDNDLLGIAYTNLRSNLKYNKNCDKVNIDGHAFSLYGLKELKKNFSLQAVATILHNYVKNKIIYSGNHITGKYRNTSLSFETLLNYRHQAKRGINIIPHIGLRYGHTKDGSYKEHDIGTQHLTVAGKSQQLWTGIIGGRILFAPKNISDSIILIPTLHGSIEKHFNSKNTAVNATITWKDKSLEDIITLPKQPKIGYNIGAGIVAKKSNTTIFMEYNCRLHKKYQSHQGMAKLKIHF
ncbi:MULTISPECIES: autotransporter domain-containing protein [unclassified Rickettsia]|uniref:autotransporter domain-containing protein n=1 Tax=unclassified Rickettsia TaxID=114295 RepID=UPI003132AFBC